MILCSCRINENLSNFIYCIFVSQKINIKIKLSKLREIFFRAVDISEFKISQSSAIHNSCSRMWSCKQVIPQRVGVYKMSVVLSKFKFWRKIERTRYDFSVFRKTVSLSALLKRSDLSAFIVIALMKCKKKHFNTFICFKGIQWKSI